MGKGTDRLKEPEQIEREVEELRAHMEPVIAELDHRRHELMDWRTQLRRRGPVLLGIAAAVIGGRYAVRAIQRKRRAHRLAGSAR